MPRSAADRVRLAPALALLLTLGVLGTGCSADPAGQAAVARSAGSSPALPAVGATVHLDGAGDTDRHTQFVQLADMGATWVRVGVPWYAVQPSAGRTDPAELARLQRLVTDATSLGLHVLFIGDQAPDWAGGGSHTASDPAAYGTFMGVLAARFAGHGPGGSSPAYELMNEPDGASPSGRPWATPAQYAAAGCAAYRTVKAEDPHATVLAGALDVSDWSTWLSTALHAGLTGCFDALSAHPYGDLSVLDGIRSVAASAGAPDVPIWVTEFGSSTCDSLLSSCVSPADQAQQLVAKLRQLGRSYPWVPVAMIYQARDEPDNPGAAKETAFGLFSATGTPKPAVAALRALLRGAPVR